MERNNETKDTKWNHDKFEITLRSPSPSNVKIAKKRFSFYFQANFKPRNSPDYTQV